MHAELGVPVSYMGIISMIISGGTVVSSLFSDKMTRKFGTRIVTVASVFLTVIALFGFSFSSQFWMLAVFAVPYGLGAGAIDSALNNYVALHYKAKHMSWLHCFWGVGTIVSPFIMGYALTNRTWNSGYRIIGFLQLAIAILLLLTLPVWNINKSATETAGKSVGLVGALKIKGVPFLLLGFFAYCALEATAMPVSYTHLGGVGMEIIIKVNGRRIAEQIEPDLLLIDFLRKHGCYSVKRGCETANCGLCTVLMDNTPVLSCSVLAARADGHEMCIRDRNTAAL